MAKRKRGAVDTDPSEESRAGPSTNVVPPVVAAATIPTPIPTPIPQFYHAYPTTYTHPPMILAPLPVFAPSLNWKHMIDALDEDTVREILLGSVLSSPHAQTAIYYKFTASEEAAAAEKEADRYRDIDFEHIVDSTQCSLDDADKTAEDDLDRLTERACNHIRNDLKFIRDTAKKSDSGPARKNAVRTLYKMAESITLADSRLGRRIRKTLARTKFLEDAMFDLVNSMDPGERMVVAWQKDAHGSFEDQLASLISSSEDKCIVRGLKRTHTLLHTAFMGL